MIPVVDPESLVADGEKVAATAVNDGGGVASVATRVGIGVDRGDGRDVLGKFTGGAGYGADAESQGLAQYSLITGRDVTPVHVRATLPGRQDTMTACLLTEMELTPASR